jgi:spermidine synthase
MDYLFVVGFVSILGQVVFLRELSVAFFGVELIYTLALGVWLLCGACGAMISRRTDNPSFSKINILLLLLSIVIPLDVAFVRSARLLFSEIPGAYLPLHTQLAIMSASLLPVGLLPGLLFQWTAKAYVAREKTLAAAYAIESVGGLAGGICATLFLKFGFQNFVIALLCALAAAGSTFLYRDGKSAKWLRPVSMIIVAALLALVWKAHPMDRFMTSWTHPNLVETRDTPYSRVTVTYRDGQTSVFENDALLFETEGTRAEEFVHLAALQHPEPKRILILGGGIEGTVREALLHSPQTVDYVELNSALLDIVPRNLPLDIRKSLRAPNVRIIHDDPRRFLDRSPSYDLILIGMPEPSSGQANRFYTQEFFRQCHAKLNAQGVAAFRLQSSENLWTPKLARKMVSIYRAARSVFPDVLFLPGSTNVVIGSLDRLTRDPSIPAARLGKRGIQTRFVSENYVRYLYTNDRFQQIARTLESGNAPINTDVRPICYQYAIMVWLSKFSPSSNLLDFSFGEMSRIRYATGLIALGLLALLLPRLRWPARRAILAGIAGFAGMVLETILFLHFQTKSGILFQDIGILLTGFMAGLAMGALAVSRIKQHASKILGVAMILGLALLCALIGMGIDSGRSAGLIGILALLFLTGFFVAGIFAFAGLHEASDQRKLIAPLYSADLLGGCIGSLLASLILAPIAGLAWTAYLIVPLALFSALLL